MGCLNKMIINTKDSIILGVWQIQNYLKTNPNYNGMIIVGSNNMIYIGQNQYIPQIFNSKQVFISSDSFQQNNIKLGSLVRKFVCNQIKSINPNKILCIGGESYLYGLTCNIGKIYHMTNSTSIHSDCEFNYQFYKSIVSNNFVNYNQVNLSNLEYNIGIINLSNLNHNLMLELNKSLLETIIIINCHHNDFWKKIKILSNYKIKSRHHFVCNIVKYFITVTILFRSKN